MPDVITLTNGQLAELAVGLTSLDGLRTKPDEFRPYKFDDDNETAWLISDNLAAVNDALKVFNRHKKVLAVTHCIADGIKITEQNAPQIAAFMTAVGELEDKTVEVSGLKKLSRARLCVGRGDKKNPIPPSVLAKLHPLLED